MALFYWGSYLETGQADIDSQHRRLFDLTNRLSDIVHGRGPLPEVGALVGDLIDYADTHFTSEEKLLAVSPLSRAAKQQHVAAHRGFLTRVQAIAAHSGRTRADSIGEFLEFLVSWLVFHILTMDLLLVRSLQPADGAPAATGSLPVLQTLISALAESERRFRQLAEQTPTLIWFCSLSGYREFVNHGWLDLTGWSEAEAAGGDWLDLVHPDDRARYAALLRQSAQLQQPDEVEYRVRAAGGEWKWLHEKIVPRHDGDRCVGLIAVATDISDIKQMDKTLERRVSRRTRQLEVLARTDALTGLPNRRAFEERFAAEVARANRFNCPLALLYFDVDHFKHVNDTYGHAAGDAVLCQLARDVRSRLRSLDLLARIGGEEFVVLLIETPQPFAGMVAEKVRGIVADMELSVLPEHVTISVGITTLGGADSPETMLNRADGAMLAAKRAGRNRSIFFPPEGDERGGIIDDGEAAAGSAR